MYVVVIEGEAGGTMAFGPMRSAEKATAVAAELRNVSQRYGDGHPAMGDFSVSLERLQPWPGLKRFIEETTEEGRDGEG